MSYDFDLGALAVFVLGLFIAGATAMFRRDNATDARVTDHDKQIALLKQQQELHTDEGREIKQMLRAMDARTAEMKETVARIEERLKSQVH